MSTWSESADMLSLPVQSFSYPVVGSILSEVQRPLTSEFESVIELARNEGTRLGETKAKRMLEDELGRERSALSAAVNELERERQRFARRVEPEVVKLALAIARKILHREAQVDPLLLAGVVRSALQRLDSSTKMRLRVSPTHSQKWKEFLLRECETGLEIVADATMTDDQCCLESEVGTTALSLTGALQEIDDKFMELLSEREMVPGVLQ
jgi:flagellar assembly protein FliH